MKFAGGVLHWSEAEFWAAGFAYFRAAWEGWQVANGARKGRGGAPSRAEYEALKAKVDERRARRKRETAE